MRKDSVTGSMNEVRKRTGDSSGNRIVKKVWIKASTEVVYRALTESKELIHWFCDRASCDPREGGELTASWRAGKTSQRGRAVITRIIPGSVLEFLWIDDGSGMQESIASHTLGYEIRSKSGMTELIMTDKGELAPDEDAITFLDQGWNSVLMELKDYCERQERTVKARPRAKSGLQKAQG
jgi:uncharacterized protein YndB with AHSA1/START domain